MVPVPDTSKAAADSMAFELGVPSMEGLIRNRYAGRTFIEGGDGPRGKAETKYTPLREVLRRQARVPGRGLDRAFDDHARAAATASARSGGAGEIHVRVACPPIIAPCFYGIDMSTIGELFAPEFLPDGQLTDEILQKMAADLGADSLRYLPVEAVARAIGFDGDQLCQACITGRYPTPWGQQLYEIAVENRATAKATAGRMNRRSSTPTASRWSPSCSLRLPKSRGPSWLGSAC